MTGEVGRDPKPGSVERKLVLEPEMFAIAYLCYTLAM